MEKVENELSPTEAGYGRLAFYLSNIVAQICVIAVCIMVGIWLGLYGGEPGLDWTNLIHRSHLHPFLTVLAFVFCSTEAILIFRMLRTISKPIVKGLHVFLHTATLAIVATSLAAMIEFNNGLKLSHFYSAHSWFGLSVVSLYVLQYILGIAFFLLPIASKSTRVAMLPFHKFFGLCTYLLALITICLGILDLLKTVMGSAYARLGTQARLGNVSCIILFILGTVVIHIATRSAYTRPSPRPDPFEPQAL